MIRRMGDDARIQLGDRELELPLIESTRGDRGIDISRLRSDLGVITVDRGFANSSENPSAVSYVDGENGALSYRGYPIEELAGRVSFLEAAWLLLYEDLPSRAEIDRFEEEIGRYAVDRPYMDDFLNTFPATSDPMATLAAGVLAMAGLHPEFSQSSRPEAVEEAVRILLADIPTLAALINRRQLGLGPISVSEDLPYTSRFFHTALAESDSSPLPDPDVVAVLDVLQILHIDHGQNCSSSAVRLVGSGGASIFSSIAAGISALSGPLHGGANRAVLGMLEEIQAGGGDIEKALHRAKDRSDPFRLMGFGHRVYRNFDPRARIIKATAGEVLSRLGRDDPLLQLAKDLEAAALADEYFAKRRLYPNVDFYSGFLYRALGFPTEMFTVLFAIGRLPGWLSHWREMASDPRGRIFRPRQVYVGRTERRLSEDR